jgi:septum formation protein
MKIILASGSERRRVLLSWLGVPFEVVVSDIDEGSVKESDPKKLVERLAEEKAEDVRVRVRVRVRDKNYLIIGADTVGFIDRDPTSPRLRGGGAILGKPKDEKDAFRMLKKLSGNTHLVYTGIAVVNARKGKTVSDVGETAVTFRKLSDKEIQDYVDTGEPLDKGAGYAIQMGAAGFVKKVRGSYTNVVGLPLVKLEELLEKSGFHLDKDVSKIVFEKTGYPE